MSETILEKLRRQMRISEERLKQSGESGDSKRTVPTGPDEPESANAAGSANGPERGHPTGGPVQEWSAYGLMTPGFLNEIVGLIDESMRNASEKTGISAPPEWVRHLQGVKKARMLLARWTDSAAALRNFQPRCNFVEMTRMALADRSSELKRWGIRADFEDATTDADRWAATPAIYLSTLHVIQSCIEQLRGATANLRLFVRVQNSGEQIEAVFLCESGPNPGSQLAADSEAYGAWHADSVELRAARNLLESAGGTLVWENIGENRKAVRISLNASAFSAEGDLKRKFRN